MNQTQQQTTAGQTFGIVGLILGLIALLLSFIPCIGMFALIPGVMAIIFSILSLNQANQGNGNKGLPIAALVVSVMATLIASIWLMFFTEFKHKHQDKLDFIEHFSDELDEKIEDMNIDSIIEDEIKDIKINIEIVDDDGDTIRIKTK